MISSAKRLAIFESMRDRLLDRIPGDHRAMTVLDFGAGPDGYILDWKGHFGAAFALDIKDFSQSYAGTEVRFLRSNGRTVPLPDGSVDVVVSHSALEHVADINLALDEINRITKVGGHIYVTISPLYYSPTGLHRADIIKNWEHLDPAHPAYLVDTPFFELESTDRKRGSSLNKLTCSDFLAAVGRQPWTIKLFEPQYTKQALPDFVDVTRFGRINLLTKGFSFVGCRTHPL